jgi:hypothetical protein
MVAAVTGCLRETRLAGWKDRQALSLEKSALVSRLHLQKYLPVAVCCRCLCSAVEEVLRQMYEVDGSRHRGGSYREVELVWWLPPNAKPCHLYKAVATTVSQGRRTGCGRFCMFNVCCW